MINLALFISGGATTASAIVKECKSGNLPVDPVLVVASKPRISGLERVKAAGILGRDIHTVDPRNYTNAKYFGEALIRLCHKYDVDLIGQYGWLPLIPVNLIKEYEGKIINQHPGPLDMGRPDFGGKGMYGRRVHAAVLYFRRKTKHDYWTEATTHFVTKEFDRGEVIKRKRVEILPTDTVEDLQKRVLPVEHEVQIGALRDFVKGKVSIVSRKKPLIMNNELKILGESKSIAAICYPNG